MVWSCLRSCGYCWPHSAMLEDQSLIQIIGPYAPAVLRFRIDFPEDYPLKAPLITFTSDIFHPLITPSATYTFSTGSQQSETVSAGDDERLPPGGFSLRHGFPAWFSSSNDVDRMVANEDSVPSLHEDGKPQVHQPAQGSRSEDSAMREGDVRRSSTSPIRIWEVLEYVKRSFDDDSLLDALPITEAANDRAWKAWQAHRKNTAGDPGSNAVNEQSASSIRNGGSMNPRSNSPRGSSKPFDEWSWDGVWQDRVHENVHASVSKSVLFGAGRDEFVRVLSYPY